MNVDEPDIRVGRRYDGYGVAGIGVAQYLYPGIVFWNIRTQQRPGWQERDVHGSGKESQTGRVVGIFFDLKVVRDTLLNGTPVVYGKAGHGVA